MKSQLLFIWTLTVLAGAFKENDQERIKLGDFARSQTGRKVPSLTASQTIGRDGPVLLADTNLLETLAHFNRERIPERVAHAKGAGAFGEFEVTHDISGYTKAALFSNIGKKTKIFVRFSTVAGELGSADIPMNPPDPRGFAIKFYTEEGIWDLTGNNLAIFPIRDPIFFPSLVHSRKRNPQTHLGDADIYWDFLSLRPESTFHAIQLFSDLGYPDGHRHMDGAGVHTFKLVNKEGNPIYCKFHYQANQQRGQRVSYDQGVKLPLDYSIRDLFDAIEQKNYPSWNFFIQVMTYEQASNWKYNPFDITKIWPPEEFPFLPVGKFTLNKNPINYFSQVESAAFSPGNFVPGIETSPDRMLQARTFSYPDAHRYRLGVNFLQLTVNRPFGKKLPKTYHRDGLCYNNENNGNNPDYFPNSLGGPVVDEGAATDMYQIVSGDVDRKDTGNENNFEQATNYYENMTLGERTRLAQNIARHLKLATKIVQKRALGNFKAVSKKLEKDISKAMKIE